MYFKSQYADIVFRLDVVDRRRQLGLAKLKDATTRPNMSVCAYDRILKATRANDVYQRALRGW